MTLEQIKAKGKCCITDKPLSSSGHINMIQLALKATWEFPTWGNILNEQKGLAVAYLHDDAISPNGSLVGEIKYAVEFKGDKIIYHDVNLLVKESFRKIAADKVPHRTTDPQPGRICRICGCHDYDACSHPVHGNCWWVEDDLCSHCKYWPGESKRFSHLQKR